MKINSITLNNIGPYKGINVFNIPTTNKKNIILIGGKNGAGKTTLLKAIKIGLFGCFSYGFRTENASYYKEVRDMLCNKAQSNDYSISIVFEYVEKRVVSSYAVTRYWRLGKGDGIKEGIYVTENGVLLEEAATADLLNKIRSMTSPALINSFIYDGEKIGAIIEAGNITSYLQGLFNSIFNIDILDQFQKDLFFYLNSKETSVSAEEYELTRYVNRINSIKSEEKTDNDYILSLSQQIRDIKIQIASLQKEFESIGGLSKENSIKLQDTIKSLEKTAENNNKLLRTFYDEYLSLFIVRKNLLRIVSQSELELPLVYREMLYKVQDYLKEDLSRFIDMLSPDIKSGLYHLNNEDIEEIKKTIELIDNKYHQIVPIISNKESLFEQLVSIRNSVSTSTEIERVDAIIEQINSLQSELAKFSEELDNKQTHLSELLKEKAVLIDKYNDLFDKQKKERLLGNSYILCSKTIKTCEQLKEHLIESKLELVNKMCCAIFNQTVRKESYLSAIEIDSSFKLKLFSDDQEVSLNYLSAGETQLLVSCIIWAMFKVSGRRELFVFDTPLARLDEENRLAFSNNIVCTISNQVIILSTDSEFIGKNYEMIADKVAIEYLLDYDDKNKITKVKAAYFGDVKK